jgi:hypothetical protein
MEMDRVSAAFSGVCHLRLLRLVTKLIIVLECSHTWVLRNYHHPSIIALEIVSPGDTELEALPKWLNVVPSIRTKCLYVVPSVQRRSLFFDNRSAGDTSEGRVTLEADVIESTLAKLGEIGTTCVLTARTIVDPRPGTMAIALSSTRIVRQP